MPDFKPLLGVRWNQGCQVFQSRLCFSNREIMLDKANFGPNYAPFKNPQNMLNLPIFGSKYAHIWLPLINLPKVL